MKKGGKGVRALTEKEYLKSAEPALRKVFLSDNPCLTGYGESAESVRLLFEYAPPEDEMTKLLLKIASGTGCDGFFFSNLNRNKLDMTTPEHWWIPFDEIDLYLSRRKDVFGDIYQLENVVYAPDGTWGIMTSFEHFGLLAGTKDYVGRCVEAVPSIEQNVEKFLEYIREYKESDPETSFPWVEAFTSRIEEKN